MIVDYRVVEALAVEFLRKRGENYITGKLLPGDGTTDLGSLGSKFNTLYVKTLHAENVTASGSTTDTVDGFHASATPKANHLLALDANAKFPVAALGDVLFKTGGTMTGNLDMAPGTLVDGIDVNLFYSEYGSHKALSAAQAHSGAGPHDHKSDLAGGDLTQYAHSDGAGSRAAYAAVRLQRNLIPGWGLTGGGMFDHDLRLDVALGNGLGFAASGAVQLNTPETIGTGTANSASWGHTHAVDASSDPSGESLLKTSSQSGLRIQRFAVGTSSIPDVGGIQASGDIRGNRIISDQDTFVGNNLSVGTSVLNTRRTRSVVYINRETDDPIVEGALTVRPGQKAQRGVVIQGKAGQEDSAPLLSVADENGQDVFVVRPDGMLESGKPAFVSGLKGWRVTGEGDAEFRNLVARGELHTSVFVANEMHATGGTLAVMSTGIVDSPTNTSDNLINTTFNLIVSGDPNNPGLSPFALNDVLRVKLITGLKEN